MSIPRGASLSMFSNRWQGSRLGIVIALLGAGALAAMAGAPPGVADIVTVNVHLQPEDTEMRAAHGPIMTVVNVAVWNEGQAPASNDEIAAETADAPPLVVWAVATPYNVTPATDGLEARLTAIEERIANLGSANTLTFREHDERIAAVAQRGDDFNGRLVALERWKETQDDAVRSAPIAGSIPSQPPVDNANPNPAGTGDPSP